MKQQEVHPLASYTMQLREYIEQVTQDEEIPVRERIEKGREKLFDFDYPIFDPDYRNVLETHFIRNFYMREIGFETEGLFKFQLETWLMINMPFYNKLFESELIKYDPLINSEMDVSHSKKNDKIQNDNRDKLMNDKYNRLQNDNRDILQNDESTKRQDGSQNSVTTNDTNQTSNIKGISNDTTDNTSKAESSKLFNGADAIDNFNRDLESTNPDNRLALTTQEGKGVIEYASKIDERLEKNKKVYDNRTRSEGTNESNTLSSTDTEQNSSSDATNRGTEDTDTTLNETGRVISSTDDKLVSSIDDTKNTTVNDKLVSSINDIEDYVQHKVGKIGVQSYPKLIQEYRQSFLRIEKQMFDEMNELFMLVY